MTRINFLVIAISFILFVLIVSAQDSIIENSVNNENNSVRNDNLIENTHTNIDTNKEGKAVTASFGVYLQIVG